MVIGSFLYNPLFLLLSLFLLFDCFSYFFGTFLVGLARAIWAIRRPETVFPVDRLVNVYQRCPVLALSRFRSECIKKRSGGLKVEFSGNEINFHSG